MKTMEASESAAFKTWELVKRGKTEVMKERRAEFMKAYRETGSFKFVTALKWNRHLVVEEIDQNRGFFTEALILQKEVGNKQSTANLIAAAKINNQVVFDEYRKEARYWYEGIASQNLIESIEKGPLNNSCHRELAV